jgi:diaminohydroxyphosphoribosylaminopyrimidine deaminase/5-amino-6-(5-phosphoribosylamino)uracil reductase
MHDDRRYLDLAARLGVRGQGDVEPNPMVGAVLVRDRRVIGMGHHRRFGGPHAEADALEDCRRRGETPRGATMYVTLEPCNHAGKQPPCSRALVAAGVANVVIARADPNPLASGGAAALREAGINVRFTGASTPAIDLGAPFAKRVTTGLPWVIAKWAQTIDGKVATRTGASQWISCPASRRRVHRLRARVDAVLTGIGTVLADDPRLTPREVGRVRRVARRIIIDPRLELPPSSALVRTLGDAPVTVVYDAALAGKRGEAIGLLGTLGIELLPAPAPAGRFDLRAALHALAARHALSGVLVEAGPRLLGSLLEQDLVDEAHVYLAPKVLGDDGGMSAARGRSVPDLAGARALRLVGHHRVGVDALLVYRRLGG